MKTRDILQQAVAIAVAAFATAGALSFTACDGDPPDPDTPVGIALLPQPSDDCPLGSVCNEALSTPYPGPEPGEWYHNIHFQPAEQQDVIKPASCTDYYFTENVHVYFKIAFETAHDIVEWKYQYIDGSGNLVGSATVAERFELGPLGGRDTASFYIQLDDSPNHQYLLVWAAADGGTDPCDFGIKLERVPAPPPSTLEAEIHGPKYVPENESCQWTAAVSGGTGSYSYSWLRNGQQIGTSKDLTANTGILDFLLRLEVGSGLETAWDTLTVIPMSGMDDCFSLE